MENQVFNPAVWFEIYVDDIQRASKFYEEVFATDLTEMSDPTDQGLQMRTFPGQPTNGGASGAIVQMAGFPAGGGSTIVYFGSEDCSIEEARVEAAGGKVHQSKLSIGPHGFISLIVDTEGNMVGIHSLK